jgi:hypothetical protein
MLKDGNQEKNIIKKMMKKLDPSPPKSRCKIYNPVVVPE